jgi:hypothetical protein
MSLFGLPDVLGLRTAAIAGGVALLVGTAAGAYVGYRWELGAYNGLKLADAQALTVATQKVAAKQRRIDALNQSDAIDQAYFRGRMDAQTVNLVLGVPTNVTVAQDAAAAAADRAGCITFGFVRVLSAAERGVPAESLNLPRGESVDTCTALEPSLLATAIAQDLAAGASNGHQLDALIAAVKRNNEIADAP